MTGSIMSLILFQRSPLVRKGMKEQRIVIVVLFTLAHYLSHTQLVMMHWWKMAWVLWACLPMIYGKIGSLCAWVLQAQLSPNGLSDPQCMHSPLTPLAHSVRSKASLLFIAFLHVSFSHNRENKNLSVSPKISDSSSPEGLLARVCAGDHALLPSYFLPFTYRKWTMKESCLLRVKGTMISLHSYTWPLLKYVRSSLFLHSFSNENFHCLGGEGVRELYSGRQLSLFEKSDGDVIIEVFCFISSCHFSLTPTPNTNTGIASSQDNFNGGI